MKYLKFSEWHLKFVFLPKAKKIKVIQKTIIFV